MAGMGPAPKPAGQRARRNATVAMKQLPSQGRTGRVPTWPLIDDIEMSARHQLAEGRLESARYALEEARGTPLEGPLESKVYKLEETAFILERKLAEQRKLEKKKWSELWKTPAAAEFERTRWVQEIAQYVRWAVLAEMGEIDAAKEARQLSDRLGLTPLALMRLRWEVAPDELAAARAEKQSQGGGTSKDRYAGLRAVGAGKPADA